MSFSGPAVTLRDMRVQEQILVALVAGVVLGIIAGLFLA